MQKIQGCEYRILELSRAPALHQARKPGQQFMRNFVIPVGQAKNLNRWIRKF
jgi:hypothetical protein